jgi:hypothetical protein
LIHAELILGLCDRFHCLPHEAEALDASVIRMLQLEEMGRRQDDGE